MLCRVLTRRRALVACVSTRTSRTPSMASTSRSTKRAPSRTHGSRFFFGLSCAGTFTRLGVWWRMTKAAVIRAEVAPAAQHESQVALAVFPPEEEEGMWMRTEMGRSCRPDDLQILTSATCSSPTRPTPFLSWVRRCLYSACPFSVFFLSNSEPSFPWYRFSPQRASRTDTRARACTPSVAYRKDEVYYRYIGCKDDTRVVLAHSNLRIG
ncbi:hypothetical protein C8R45DRAFT_1033906 [Mycena sanguinolenta]|nr:hypothetical protein C8R45DRAFT_1033906 [Mycena sanguinolenta]